MPDELYSTYVFVQRIFDHLGHSHSWLLNRMSESTLYYNFLICMDYFCLLNLGWRMKAIRNRNLCLNALRLSTRLRALRIAWLSMKTKSQRLYYYNGLVKFNSVSQISLEKDGLFCMLLPTIPPNFSFIPYIVKIFILAYTYL